ncbi:MAG: class I SAM-dependent methyltransferase [Butyrivibrio sp.]|jgi:SAM-dependent methyltransferase|nr:class I SAM-dependent methyltransferase [Butyrivibrio sp.]
MPKQNIYDNEVFFSGYKGIRDQEVNANVLFEIPNFFEMLPSVEGKKILDLGCGFGEHCKRLVELGASSVTGIDISVKMLEIAQKENADSKITYIHMPMEDISTLNDHYDIIVSSLAFHYIEAFKPLIVDIYRLLTEGGVLVFSQEHPFSTCYRNGFERWTKDENGKKLYLNLCEYGIERENESKWFVDNVKKYHRTFSTIVNTLADAGFSIEKMVEPTPDETILSQYPGYRDLFHKPDFLLIRAKKN